MGKSYCYHYAIINPMVVQYFAIGFWVILAVINGCSIFQVRTMLNYETKNPDKLPDWLKEYPVTLTQFLFYLYHNVMVRLISLNT